MARRRHAVEGPHDNEERWLLTYADMITLLMVLFVVMYAISNTDARKFIALMQSVSAAFNADVIPGERPVTVVEGGAQIPADKNYDDSSGVVNTDYRQLTAALQDYAIAQGLGAQVEVARIPEGIVIRLNEALLFSPGRAHLDDHAVSLVAEIAAIVKPLPNQVRVEGNTDDQPPSGGLYADNWQLSTARALAVLDALEKQGLSASRLCAAGYAEFNPVVPNTDEASRAKNRRVDILVLYPKAGSQNGQSTPAPAFETPGAS